MVVLFAFAWAGLACIKLRRVEDARRFPDEPMADDEQSVGLMCAEFVPP
jgi:hypothetical protein